MKSSIWLFISFCFLHSCKEPAPPPEPLDPELVSIAGENYKDYLIEEIKPPEADTIKLLEFESKHFTFDLLKPQAKIAHRFTYSNVGDTSSYVQLITSACQCIQEDSKKEILNPGESAELNITFDPQLWEPGESKSLFVFTKHFPHQVELIIERNK